MFEHPTIVAFARSAVRAGAETEDATQLGPVRLTPAHDVFRVRFTIGDEGVTQELLADTAAPAWMVRGASATCSAYCASKGALNSVHRHVAAEVLGQTRRDAHQRRQPRAVDLAVRDARRRVVQRRVVERPCRVAQHQMRLELAPHCRGHIGDVVERAQVDVDVAELDPVAVDLPLVVRCRPRRAPRGRPSRTGVLGFRGQRIGAEAARGAASRQ